jgi:hypothetical protein
LRPDHLYVNQTPARAWLRRAVRAVILADDDRVLLCRFSFLHPAVHLKAQLCPLPARSAPPPRPPLRRKTPQHPLAPGVFSFNRRPEPGRIRAEPGTAACVLKWRDLLTQYARTHIVLADRPGEHYPGAASRPIPQSPALEVRQPKGSGLDRVDHAMVAVWDGGFRCLFTAPWPS